jgi:hypothetical protein
MNIPCKNCGNESSESDKFCRQCGQPTAESEFSLAATLNHAKGGPNPADANTGSVRFSPKAGEVLSETERYYTPPQYAPPAIYISQPSDPALSSAQTFTWPRVLAGFMKGTGIFLLVAGLLTSTGMAVYFKMESDQEAQRRSDVEQRARIPQGGDANGQAQDIWGQINDALRYANEAEKRARIVEAAISSNEEKSIDLTKFYYPGAQVEARSSIYGTKSRSQITYQNLNTVKDFYIKQFGQPILQGVWRDERGNEREKLLIQASTSPSILIRIEKIDETQVRITILQTLLRFNNKLD